MSDKMVQYIMDRKILEVPKFGLRNILKYCDMSMYEKICTHRIIDEIGLDFSDVIVDFAVSGIYLTHKGIKKCEGVLLSYCNSDQMAEILEYIKQEEERVISVNNVLWFLWKKTVKELHEIQKESEAKGYHELCEVINAEIRSRSCCNKTLLFLKDRFFSIVARIMYYKVFKDIKMLEKGYGHDSKYKANLDTEDRPAIIS